MPQPVQMPLEASRAPAGAMAHAADRSAWRATCLEAIAVASALVVFIASAIETPPAPTHAHTDAVVHAPQPGR
jgi:hypothetical protein